MSRDLSGQPCTSVGSVWTPSGRTFDGLTQKIVIPDRPSLRFTGPFTVSFWGWHPADVSADRSFLSKYTTGTGISNYEIYFDGGVTNRLLARWTHNYAGTAAWRVLVCSELILPNNWYHIAFTHNTGVFTFFINGKPDNKTSFLSDTIDNPAADIWLGIRNNNASKLECTIGEVSIYNRALSSGEIQQNYLETKFRYL